MDCKSKQIILGGKNGGFCLVSNDNFDILNEIKWNANRRYVCGHIPETKKSELIHRYIFRYILNIDITDKIIDHINGNPLDNRLENLRIITHSGNVRNRSNKNENSTSKYYGVSKAIGKTTGKTTGKIWRARVKINGNVLIAHFEKEIHAVCQYNHWCDEYKIEGARVNEIEIPDDFIPHQKKIKILPKHITIKGKKYKVALTHNKIFYYLGSYENLEEAVKIRDQKIDELKQNDVNDFEKENPNSIKRNKDGYCIIEHFNIKKEKIGESIVDEDDYFDLIKYKWSLHNKKYAKSLMNGKIVLLSRYIMKYSGKNFVDHINHNPLDNRKENLRIVTPHQNALNKISRENSSSQYVGVSWNKHRNNWLSYITINGKTTYIGSFKNEIDAHNARQVEYEKLMAIKPTN